MTRKSLVPAREAVFELPKRLSLAEVTANSVRKAIFKGVWEELLPTERELSEVFRVSRPTLRTALHLLAGENLIEIKQGRRIRLTRGRPRGVRRESRLICVVAQLPETGWSLQILQVFAQIRSQLAAEGFAIELLVCDGQDARAQERMVHAYIQHHRVFCCILMSLKYEIQRWFAERSIPAIVVGMCDPGLKLSSIHTDLRSSCRHAAGVFLRHGHRRLAILVPNTGRGGDLESELGFTEVVAQAPARYGARAVVVRHNNSGRQVEEKLKALFETPGPPTALLVARTAHVYTTLFFLQRRGLRVPEEVSVIARDHDPAFALTHPAIAHYQFDPRIFANRLTRKLLKLVTDKQLVARATMIDQQFYAGGTVAQL